MKESVGSFYLVNRCEDMFSSFRSDIRGERWTPLHYACYNNKEEIVKFLIEEEKKRARIEGGKECGVTKQR